MGESILRGGINEVLGSRLLRALTTPHGVERYLEPFNAMWSVDRVKARIVSVHRSTEDSVTLQLQPNRLWQGFKAGQYVRVQVDIGGVRRSRCYSLSSAEQTPDGFLEITVKHQPGGLVSSFLNHRARTGMVLELSQAEGDFVLPDLIGSDVPAPLLLIAGGSGITPVMSMLRTLHLRQHAGVVSLVYYTPSAATTLFATEIEALFAAHPQWRLRVRYTRDGATRRFADEHLEDLVDAPAPSTTYVCGPAALIESVRSRYDRHGYQQQLKFERFSAAPTPTVIGTDASASDLKFIKSERYVVNDGRSLLDQAEAAGLRPEAGCRMGICHSCTCRKTSGVVRDLRTGTLSSAGEEDIQICVSAAVGDVTLDL